MKILVTGATGFIGKSIVNRLLLQDHTVLGSGRSTDKLTHHNYTFQKANLTSKDECRLIVEDIDIIIHCAGKAGTWGSEEGYVSANIVGTKNLIEACSVHQRFINISSPSIYFKFEDQLLLKEDQVPTTFSNAYAETKYKAEKIVEQANRDGRVQTISLRPRGVIGIGDKNWLPRIISLRAQNKLTQPGDGKNIVDFTSIENLLDAIEICFKTPKENLGRTYNITNGTPEKLWDVIDYSLSAVGLDGQRKKVPAFVAMGAARLSKLYHTLKFTHNEPDILPLKVGVATYSMTLDISDAREKLGYSPRVTTRDSIDKFAEWWMEQERP